MNTFLAICLNPTLQKTLVLPRLVENEVNRSGEYYLDIAGKGVNVARVFTQLGMSAVHLTHLGGRNTDLFLELAAADGVPIRWVDSGSEIRFCHTLIATERRTTTEIVEEAAPVSDGTEARLLAEYRDVLRSVKVVTISGSKAAGYGENLFPTMVKMAKDAGLYVVLDYRGADLISSLPFSPDVIKPNYAEFVQTFLSGEMSVAEIGEHSDDPGLLRKVREKMLDLRESHHCEVVLTRGAHDVLYTHKGGVSTYTPPRIRPINTIGSGDAFTAGLAATLHAGESLPAAVAKGVECAARNAELIRPGIIR